MSATRLLMLSSALAAAMLVGCSKAPSKSPPAKGTPAAASSGDTASSATQVADTDPAAAALPPQDLGEFKIISITLGSRLDAEKNVIEAKTQFSTKDSIHAAVVSTGKHQGLKITAKWTLGDGTPVAESEQVLVPDSPLVSTFSLSNAEPWPVGMYQVGIFLEGREQLSIPFEVR